ncbi:MAG: 2-oxo-4-hydroxy-4-carboxy-5-ureidoimidazoline decarboxylase [Gemmatimonadales bacterium]|nr:2-oxo-4-hydroxy-4-carboxy-5-ureidoimidazoline decarboxylase [Gemmatimonadales bacterium]MBA3555134.1 2-oxo-4-hydroxy-4-carboxy-5-ureidoimidazoline decarboxylase [Gemmatimonadales bacterium]
MTLEELNALPRPDAAERLRSCCGSSRWVEGMLRRRPFASLEALLAAADDAWRETGPADWDEAFAHHPRIGERHAAAPASATAQSWSAGEQRAVAQSGAGTRAALADASRAYERRFGRIYLVCAAGRSAEELLADMEARMNNDPERERAVAAEEQRKITRLRLRALVGSEA